MQPAPGNSSSPPKLPTVAWAFLKSLEYCNHIISALRQHLGNVTTELKLGKKIKNNCSKKHILWVISKLRFRLNCVKIHKAREAESPCLSVSPTGTQAFPALHEDTRTGSCHCPGAALGYTPGHRLCQPRISASSVTPHHLTQVNGHWQRRQSRGIRLHRGAAWPPAPRPSLCMLWLQVYARRVLA